MSPREIVEKTFGPKFVYPPRNMVLEKRYRNSAVIARPLVELVENPPMRWVATRNRIGYVNCMTGHVRYHAHLGIPDGPVLEPAPELAGKNIQCEVPGTIPSGPAAGITLEHTNQFIVYYWNFPPPAAPSENRIDDVQH